MRYPGQYYDQETGLHYNYFRDYEPETGRYVESDPVGLQGGVSTYGYVKDNPLSFIDFFGLCRCTWTGKTYDGGFYDRHSYIAGFIPITEGKQNCVYKCSDNSGGSARITHVQQEWYFGHSSGGASNAKKFICPMEVKNWIAHYDLVGHVSYYEPVLLGSFDPRGSGVKELENWAAKKCNCQN